MTPSHALHSLLTAIENDIKKSESIKPKMEPEIRAARLKATFAKLSEANSFAPGDLVTDKAGCLNKKPMRDGFAVVTKVLGQPVVSPCDNSGSPYFREHLDIVVGIIDCDGDFLEHHCDSRRLEHYTPEAAQPSAE